jgi:hypothetical protein
MGEVPLTRKFCFALNAVSLEEPSFELAPGHVSAGQLALKLNTSGTQSTN